MLLTKKARLENWKKEIGCGTEKKTKNNEKLPLKGKQKTLRADSFERKMKSQQTLRTF